MVVFKLCEHDFEFYYSKIYNTILKSPINRYEGSE